MRRMLIKIKSSFKPDLVQFEYNVMHHYTDLFHNIPKILVQHDISTKVYERGAIKSQTKSGRRKNYQLFKIAKKSEIQNFYQEIYRARTLQSAINRNF